MHKIKFPCSIYGRDWNKPINDKVTQEQLYKLIQRGLVRGVGSWSKLRKICFVDMDNMAMAGHKPAVRKGYRLKFPLPDVIDKTTEWQQLPDAGVHVIRHHAVRCSAASPRRPRVPWV